jgi:SAM-dependent methyltransferase
MLLARGPLEVRYGAIGWRPRLRHDQRVVVESAASPDVGVGDVVLARSGNIVDLLRVVRLEADRIVLAADADPGPEASLAPGELLGRACVPRRRSTPAGRRFRRAARDLAEMVRGRPDDAGDPSVTVKDKYDAQAPFYATTVGPELEPPLLERIRSSVPEGGRILVAGSGSGRECFALARLGWLVTRIDFAPAMVAAAREEAARRTLPAEFRIADLRTHDEPARSLDGVLFTYEVYSFLPDRRDRVALLRRMLSWLRPDGVLFLSARRTRSPWDRIALTIQCRGGMRPGWRWGASHTRWLTTSGELRRSFIHVFTDGALRRELDEAGAESENWVGGHTLVRRRGAAGDQEVRT